MFFCSLLVTAPGTLYSSYDQYSTPSTNIYLSILNDTRFNVPLDELSVEDNRGKLEKTLEHKTTKSMIDWTKTNDLLFRVAGSETDNQFDSLTSGGQQYGYFRQDSNEYNNFYSSTFHAYMDTKDYNSFEQGVCANQSYGTEHDCDQHGNSFTYPLPRYDSGNIA